LSQFLIRPEQGRIQKFFEGGFEMLLYGRENFGGFWDFFLNNPSKLKQFQRRGG